MNAAHAFGTEGLIKPINVIASQSMKRTMSDELT